MFSGSLGIGELLLVLGVVLLIFGPKRLPGLGKQLGRGLREFKHSVTGDKYDKTEADGGEPPEAIESREDADSKTRA